ncbi:S-type pyocin domain-containing protein [Pseudomonas tensinigenes]|uniref:S-type pyocin domain-containing protein n=1 Tax=Pseudomonas tensinigenes TaxID=2745511 RepID=A0ABX8Q0W9_9PSED|nr:S-type pyocin domain-containing protein [Pseudomonas tensinigenes]QXI07177.1 S-type pyocin domain-containing protein [Pseudomonas tensinigenes]
MQKPPPWELTEAVHTTAIAPAGIPIIPATIKNIPNSGAFDSVSATRANIAEFNERTAQITHEFKTRTEQIPHSIEQELAATRLEGTTHPLPPAQAIMRELQVRHTLIARKTAEHHQKTAVANQFFGDTPLNKNFHDYYVKVSHSRRTYVLGIADAWVVSYRAAHEANLLSQTIQLLNQQQIDVHKWLATVQAQAQAAADAQRVAAERARIAQEQQRQRELAEAARLEQARLAALAQTQRLAEERTRIAAEQQRQSDIAEAARLEQEQVRVREQARIAALAEKQRQDAHLASLASEVARINAEAEAQEKKRVATLKAALAEAQFNMEAAAQAFAAEQARLNAEMEQRIEAIQSQVLAEEQSLEIRRKVIETATNVAKRQARLATLKIQQQHENQRHLHELQAVSKQEEEALKQKRQPPEIQQVYPASGVVASTRPHLSFSSTAIRLPSSAASAILDSLRVGLLTVKAAATALISGPVLVGFAALLMPSRLGNGERFSMSVPLAELSSESAQTLRETADRQGTLELPVGLGVRRLGAGAEVFVATSDDFHIRSSVLVLNAAYDLLNDVYEVALPDSPTDFLTWTPAISPGDNSTESPMVDTDSPAYTGAPIVPIEGRLDLNPILVEGWERFIIVFPDDSGIAPLYVVFSSPYAGATTKGEYSGRDFNPEQAGGPILDLDWRTAVITQTGIDAVKLHIARLDQSDANEIMIQRLEKILCGHWEFTDTDLRYYTHEVRELERFRALGLGDDFKPDRESPLWNNAHTATLEDFKLRDDESLLYSQDAIAAADKQDELFFKNLLKGGKQ